MVTRGGASLVAREPIFSKDGKRLLVCSACTVTVFSVQTGEVLAELKGHKGVVTSVLVVPVASVCHCWTASLDGTIRFWDFAAGVSLRTVNVGRPVESMVIPELCKPRREEEKKGGAGKRRGLIGFLSVSWEKEVVRDEDYQGRVICFNITTGKQIPGHLAKTRVPERLYISPAGNLVGMPDDRKVWVWMVPPAVIDLAGAIPVTLLHHTKRMCVIAFDVSETRVAAGDFTGRILVWENVGDRTFSPLGAVGEVSIGKGRGRSSRSAAVRGNDDASALSTHHWHAHDVRALLFTIDGVYLLSGGMEGVLVIWQLETGKRNFLPRLGGQVVSIVPSLHPSLFAIACMDNSIKLLNIGTMEIERTIQGIYPSFPVSKELTVLPAIVSVDPAEGKIVVASHNLSLQFYDIASDKHVGEVQVTARNYVTDSRDYEEGPSTSVTRVAFSADGACMATVDVRLPERNIGGEVCLKFWDRVPGGKVKFNVNTQVDETLEVSALAFRPGDRMAVSASSTNFKLWIPYERTASKRSWRCRSVGHYRQRAILAAAFSPDGTILAVAAGEFLTLWNPETNALLRVLSNSAVQATQPINHLAFANHSHCLLAATASSSGPSLTVWDLERLSVRWSVAVEVEALAVDPARASFAVLARVASAEKKDGLYNAHGVLALFDIDSPCPLQYWTVRDVAGGSLFFNPIPQPPSPASDANATDTRVVVPSSKSSTSSKLTFITSDREFIVFNPYQIEEEEEEGKVEQASTVRALSEDASAFAAVYGNKGVQKLEKKDAPQEILSALSRAPWGTLLNGPTHVLPSLSVVAIPFLDSLMIKRKE